MQKTIKIEIRVSGTCTDEELKEFIEHEFGAASCSLSNPFVHPDGDAEVEMLNVQIEN